MTEVSRPELLAILKQLPEDYPAEQELLDFLGYEQREAQKQEPLQTLRFQAEGSEEELKKPTPTAKPELPPAAFWYLHALEKNQPSSPDDPNRPFVEIEGDLVADEPVPPMAVSPAQVIDWLNAEQRRSRQIDIPKTVERLSKAEPLNNLPKRQLAFVPETLLFIDMSQHLVPIWPDQHYLMRELTKIWGKEVLQTLRLRGGPDGSIHRLNPTAGPEWTWDELSEKGRVVFFSDLGYASPDSDLRNRWRAKIQSLSQRGFDVKIIWPLEKIPDELKPFSLALCNQSSKLPALKRAVAECLQPKVERLRDLRQTLGASLEDEIKVWNSPDGSQQRSLFWRLDEKKRAAWLNGCQFNGQERGAVTNCHDRWRLSLYSEEQALEALIEEIRGGRKVPSAVFNAILVAIEASGDEFTSAHQLLRDQSDIIRLNKAYIREQAHLSHFLSVYEGHIEPHVKDDETAKAKEGQKLFVSQVGDQLGFDHAPLLRSLNSVESPASLVDSGERVRSSDLISGDKIKLRDHTATQTFKKLHQPSWATRFWGNADGSLGIEHVSGMVFILQPADWEVGGAYCSEVHNLLPWAKDAGVDVLDGKARVWADLVVKGAIYRMHWIEPDTFMMGSPENEDGRFDREKRHEVTLTQGYWLGETSCTQEFWLAVMGNNPASNKDDKMLPVERVSWDDCQSFMQNLDKATEGFLPRLPTEAEWEYACRAGTKTAYYWGESFDESKANNGSGTVVETKYEPNAFGIRSMHGNVYEWCQDWFGDYSKSLNTDLQGPQDGQFRVLRGGSWIDSPQFLRSAYRNDGRPDRRGNSIGFRLAGGIDPQASKGGAALTADRMARSDIAEAGIDAPGRG
jgi:hypothetical protein